MISRRSLLKGSLACLLSGTGLVGYAFGIEPHLCLKVARYRVTPRLWPTGLHLRIAAWGYSPVVPSRYGNRYAYGHVVENDRDLIVSGGLGCAILPVRIGVPPEIVLVDVGTA